VTHFATPVTTLEWAAQRESAYD